MFRNDKIDIEMGTMSVAFKLFLWKIGYGPQNIAPTPKISYNVSGRGCVAARCVAVILISLSKTNPTILETHLLGILEYKNL